MNLKVEESGQFFNYIFLDGTQLMRRLNTTPKVWTGIQANSGLESGLNIAASGSYSNLQLKSKLFFFCENKTYVKAWHLVNELHVKTMVSALQIMLPIVEHVTVPLAFMAIVVNVSIFDLDTS